MKNKRARSGGVRNPVRNAVVYGFISLLGIVLVVLGVADIRETGRSGSPLLALGLFPALLCPMLLIYYVSRIRAFRDMQSGRAAMARWTVPSDEFTRFREEQQRIPAHSILTNYYEPPRTTPDDGVEVIFSKDGVLIGGGYFPLSITGGRRLQSVRYSDTHPPSIEFVTVMRTIAQTSSATINSSRAAQTLRVPVASDSTKQAAEVVRHYQSLLDQR